MGFLEFIDRNDTWLFIITFTLFIVFVLAVAPSKSSEVNDCVASGTDYVTCYQTIHGKGSK